MFKAASRPPAGRFASLVRWLRTCAHRVEGRAASRLGIGDAGAADILDLLDQLIYTGEVTPDGEYTDTTRGSPFDPFTGGPVPEGMAPGEFWESRVHPDDRGLYAGLNRDLLLGEDCEATYRLDGVDGVTRVVRDRARPRPRRNGGMLIRGIITDVTQRAEADARLAEASDRFARLLGVVGSHVYMAEVLPEGRIHEFFQGPGVDRLLGESTRDDEMANWVAAVDPSDRDKEMAIWDAAVHPSDRVRLDAFNRMLRAGEDAEVEYRLIGADGITRWVHDRGACRRRPDGKIEISGIVSDVTDRRRMRTELAETHAALSRVVDAMDDHLYTLRVDADGGYRAVYRGPHRDALAGGRFTGGIEEDRLWESLLHPDDRELWRSSLARLAEGQEIELEYRVVGLDGAERIVLDRLRPRRGADGSLFYDGATRDISEHRRLEAELRRARGVAELSARTDELTGAFNRRHFAEIVAEALAADPDGCGLLLLDADHFKQVNDAHGHVMGDAVLVELARRLAAGLGPDDCLARWGGEEFAVLLRGVDTDRELERRAQRLRAAVALLPVAATGISVRLTISIGAARAGAQLETLDALVEAADRCLYAAKRDGRNRVSLVADRVASDVPPGEPDSVGVARALALASGVRGGPPEAHAEHVAELAADMAEHMALADGLVLRCRLGGWLHDVGKVAIPERILTKPGPLDDAEWALMRTHPVVGEEMVRGVAALRGAAGAVRHHHERYDGSGYPDNLAGGSIPVEARIVAAADAYSAMTTVRPYSPARTQDEAAIELRRSAGSHLDPQVVEALLAVLDQAVRPAAPSGCNSIHSSCAATVTAK